MGDAFLKRRNDDLTWKLSTIPDGYWSAVTYGDGKFVAVGDNSVAAYMGAAYMGSDMQWRNDGVDIPVALWTSIAYGNGVFLAISGSIGGRSACSAHGIQWIDNGSLGNDQWWSLSYGDGVFVAVAFSEESASSTNKSAYCESAAIWRPSTLPLLSNWQGIAYGDGVFVAVGGGGIGAYSVDRGRTWKATNMPYGGWRSVTYGAGKFVAVGGNVAAYTI